MTAAEGNMVLVVYLQVLLFCMTSARWKPDSLQKPSLL